MGRPRIGVLALQGDVREHLRLLAECGVDAMPVRLPGELEGLQALVMPGGESTTMAHLINTFGLLDPLRQAEAAGMAVLATCAGTILAAREIEDGLPDQLHLGWLDISVRRNAFGRQIHSGEVELAVPEVGPEPVPVVLIRAPSIEKIGAEVEVLAWHNGQPAGVRQGRHIGLICHPEITGDARLHQLFLSRL